MSLFKRSKERKKSGSKGFGPDEETKRRYLIHQEQQRQQKQMKKLRNMGR